MNLHQHRRRRIALGLACAVLFRVERADAVPAVTFAELDRALDAMFDRIPPNTPRAIRRRIPLDATLIVVDDHVFEQLRQNQTEVRP